MLDLHGISRASFGDALMKLWPQGDKHIAGLRQAMIDQIEDVASKWGFDCKRLAVTLLRLA